MPQKLGYESVPALLWRLTTASLLLSLITAIGISRLYLGVHWFTDIVAGYAVGFLWLMVCITLLKLQTRKKMSGLLKSWE